jgi:hypothetical protein
VEYLVSVLELNWVWEQEVEATLEGYMFLISLLEYMSSADICKGRKIGYIIDGATEG